MAFSDGQLVFAALVLAGSFLLFGLAYRKDLKMAKVMGKNVWKMLVFILGTLTLFYVSMKLAS